MPQPTPSPEIVAKICDALQAGDPARALTWTDQLPAPDRPPHLAEIWMQVGSHRALRLLLPQLAGPHLSQVQAFLRTPRRWPEPTETDYDALSRHADALASKGRAAELAMIHRAMAQHAPRADWSAVHWDHALLLADELEDDALIAQCAYDVACRDQRLGEIGEALDAVQKALRHAQKPQQLMLILQAQALHRSLNAQAKSDPEA